MKEGWTYKKLGEVCDIFNGNSINADYKKEHYLGVKDGLPFIATKDVLTNGKVDYDNGVRIPNFKDFKIAPAKSVFICAEGGSAGKKYAYIEKDVCFGNKLFCLNPKVKNLDGKYVFHYIQSDLFKKQFQSLITGLIGGVSAKKFQSIEILLPPFEEQQRIVSRLDAAFSHIDELKANAEKEISEARTLLQKALAKAMEPKEGWKEYKLKELTIKIGSGATPRGGKNVYINEGVSLVRSMNVHNNEFKYKDLAHINADAANQLNGVELKEDDVLFNITGASIARCCIIPNDVLPGRVNQHVAIIRTRQDLVLPRFLCLCLLSSEHQKDLLEIGVAGSTRQAITKADLENHVIIIPSLSEQQHIVRRLDALSIHVREFEENQKKIISECDTLKQALLRKVFE